MKLCVWLTAAAIAVCPDSGASAAQDAPPGLTMQQAIDEALQKNLSLLAQRMSLSVADAALITARLRPNPVLTGDADGLDLLGTGFNAENGAGPQQYAVRVDVPFERGGKRELRTSLAGAARRVAEAQFADAARRLKQDVTLACVDVLEAKAMLQLAQDNFHALEQLVQLNDRRLSSGAIPELEVTRSRVAMLQYRSSVRNAELVLASARLKLLPLLGRTAGAPPVDIVDPLGLTPAAQAPDLESLQQTARLARPDLAALRYDQARTQADVRLQVAQGKVDYTVGAEYRRQQGVNARGNMVGVFVSVPLPVFNRNQGEIARAGAERDKSGRSVAALENDLASEVTVAHHEYESARTLLADIERDLLKPTREARAGTVYVYQAGATSLLDVLDAQRAFNETMATYYAAQATYRRAQARLALAVGKDVLP
jgi:cobalt-zinc-cadmium efflux system outer membrane protein